MAEIDLDWRSLLLEDTSSHPFPSARAFVQQEFAEANAELLATAGPSGANVSEVARSIARGFDALALSLVVRVTDATSAASCVRELDTLLNWWLEHYGRVFQPMHPDVGFAIQELQAITRIRLTERTLRRKTDAWRYASEPKDPRVVSSDEVGAEQRLRAEALARVAPGGISGAEHTGATGLSGGSSARASAGPTEQAAIEDRPSSPQYPNRATWLSQRLTERQWTKHTVQGHGGPEHRTVQKVLDGQSVGDLVLNRLATALSQSKKHPPVAVVDIPQD